MAERVCRICSDPLPPGSAGHRKMHDACSKRERMRRWRARKSGIADESSAPRKHIPAAPAEIYVLVPPKFYVYVFYDNAQEVLYVGQTKQPANRMSSHKCRKPWFTEVARVQWFQFPDRRQALDREGLLIRSLFPRHNRAGAVHAL